MGRDPDGGGEARQQRERVEVDGGGAVAEGTAEDDAHEVVGEQPQAFLCDRRAQEPFFLRPETPPEGLPLPTYVRERMKDPDNPLRRRAEREGLQIVRRDIVRSTRRAHEAVEYARAHGKRDPLHASLLRRYWTEAQDLYALETLREAAREVCLDADDLARAIETGVYREAVEAEVRSAYRMGIDAVPTFLFNDQLVVEGAQELPVFRKVLERLGADRRPDAPA